MPLSDIRSDICFLVCPALLSSQNGLPVRPRYRQRLQRLVSASQTVSRRLLSTHHDLSQTSNYVAFATTGTVAVRSVRNCSLKSHNLNPAWLFYESLITFDSEAHLFWTKRLTGASAMFFVARYTTLAYALVNLLGTLDVTISDEVRLLSCDGCHKVTFDLRGTCLQLL